MRLKKYTMLLTALLLVGNLLAAGQPYAEIVSYDYSQGQGPLHKLTEIVRATPADKVKEVEANILATLEDPNCTDAGRFFCFKLLRWVAGPATARKAGKYLLDEDYADIARYAIEGIVDDEATAVLQDALKKSSGRIRMGIIMSLGERRDGESVKTIAKALKDEDKEMVAAALQALGNIATKDAVKALSKARCEGRLAAKRDNAMLICAENMMADGDSKSATKIAEILVKSSNRNTRLGVMMVLAAAQSKDLVPVLQGAIKDPDAMVAKTAVTCLGESGDRRAAEIIASAFSSLSADVQVAALNALGNLGDGAACPVVEKAMLSGNGDVARAALVTLGKIGSAGSIDALLAVAAKDASRGKEVTAALSQLKGKGIVSDIIQRVAGADEATGVLLVDSLKARGDKAAAPGMLGLLSTGKDRVDRAMTEAIARLGQAKDLDAMVALMVRKPETIASLEKAVVLIIKRDSVDYSAPLALAVDASTGEAKAAILRIYGQVGGEKIVATLVPYLKSGDEALVDAAVRGLVACKQAAAMGPMTAAVGTVKSDTHKILLSRAVVELVASAKLSRDRKAEVIHQLIKAVPETEKKSLQPQLEKYAPQEGQGKAGGQGEADQKQP